MIFHNLGKTKICYYLTKMLKELLLFQVVRNEKPHLHIDIFFFDGTFKIVSNNPTNTIKNSIYIIFNRAYKY